MNRIKTLLAIGLLCICTGCISTINHFGNENDYPYRATCEVWNQCICVWGNPAKTIHGEMGRAYIKLTYPFWLVDLPLEVVEDTLCFPWDIYKYYSLKNSRGVQMRGVSEEEEETPIWKKISD